MRQLQHFKDNNQRIFEAVELIECSIIQGNKVLVFGNGGSAAQSSHFSAELVNKFYLEREGLPAIALTTDTACLTSIANDMDFKHVFSRQLEALGKPGDIALGLTTSGKSPNVIEAFLKAKQLQMKTIALCGNNTRQLDIPGLNIDAIVSVPSTDTPLIQEMHLFILHTMADMLEQKFFTGDK
ncbi:MAG: SIS domain-containing protein [Candidatus Aminicenantes bacterium]|nr:MAG: SIS domain-containing protein [Candidatus Aminicenantes bacterium]